MRSEIKWDPESLWVLPVSSDTGTGNNYKYSLLTPLPFLPIPHCPVSSPWALAQETPPVLVGAKQEEGFWVELSCHDAIAMPHPRLR
ncbi:Hypothetical protein SMAX5B_010422 [Scophthalmus maximus]|uniref:Uncharacterized protein n=1 Tax=Scophthalmus maximus TaxID=52904 RepID=A0A2U9BTG7_SCOMX|nr:Hypothetical protein SMAX5B_010422 [Scophthalmus maximus]